MYNCFLQRLSLQRTVQHILVPLVKRSSSSSASASTSTMSTNQIDTIRESFRRIGPGGSLRLTLNDETGIGLLRIQNVTKKNCFTGSMMAELTEHLEQVEKWKNGKALIIYGENGFFCSGGDLNTVRSIADQDGGRKMITLMQHNLKRLECLPLITVALVDGMALGGGAELMTACDYRIASRDSKIGFVQVRIGITTVWGGGARLVSIIGYGRALNLIATGRTFTADDGVQLGFIDHVLPSNGQSIIDDNDALKCVEEFLQPFLSLPRETMLNGKCVTSSARNDLDRSLAEELEHGLKVWGGPVHSAALSGKVNHRRGEIKTVNDKSCC